MYLSRDSNTKQISSRDCELGPARTPQPLCFDWGSGAVLLKATYLRCSDIRQPFPGKSGFHIRRRGFLEEREEIQSRTGQTSFASKDFFFLFCSYESREGNSSEAHKR